MEDIEKKMNRVIGLVRCLGLATENEESKRYLENPCHYLVEEIEEELRKIQSEITEI
jgi:hypothetical protein